LSTMKKVGGQMLTSIVVKQDVQNVAGWFLWLQAGSLVRKLDVSPN